MKIPSMTPYFHLANISASNRKNKLLKFGELFDVNLPDFESISSAEELTSRLSSVIGTQNVKKKVSEKVAGITMDKISEAIANKLQNAVTVLTFRGDDSDELFPTCNGRAAHETGWMSKVCIGPFPGEWHTDVTMPDYAMIGFEGADASSIKEKSMAGGGLFRRAGAS